nr:venom protein U-MPTX.17-42 [Megalopyge opercularis]
MKLLLTLFLTGFILLEVVAKEINTKYENRRGKAPWWNLNDGQKIPAIGLGTFQGESETFQKYIPPRGTVNNAIKLAIDIGYRHFDTASYYDNEDEIGQGVKYKIADGTVTREDIFITTKLWNDRHGRENVVPALRESLERFNLSYVDLFNVHWPISQFPNESYSNIDYVETWQGMIEARDLGLTKSIGVSNFNQKMIDRLIKLTRVAPAVLEVEINLNLQQPKLVAYCRKQNITVTGFTPYGSLFPINADAGAPPPRVDDPTLQKIAKKHNKTVPQIALRYLVDLGVIPLPKSNQKAHMEENINIFDFQLTKEDKQILRGFDRNYRVFPEIAWHDSQYYPF